MAQEATGAILTALEQENTLGLTEALESFTEPTEAISAVSDIVHRNVSPYNSLTGDYIGGIDPDTFDLTSYLVDRLIRWNRRNTAE